MQRYILVYGPIAGAIVIASAIVATELAGSSHVASQEWLGYLVMLLALSMIFVGIKRYRDQALGGTIRFATATLLGLGISAVAGVVYVAAWEVYLAMTDHAFIDAYIDGVVAERRAAGLAGAELEQLLASMESMRTQYANPLFRIPVTFLEIFPVGLIITLVSAAILRNSRVLPATETAA